MMCAAHGRAARAPRAADRSCARSSARRSASPAAGAATSPTCTRARELPLAEPALLPLGAGALHAAGFHRAGRAARHRVPREDARASCSATTARSRSSTCCKAECDRGGVEWRMPCEVRAVARDGERFRGRHRGRAPCARASLVVATGGLSVPKIGATPFGYRLAEQFGLRDRAAAPGARAAEPRPPETLARFGDLSGVSLDAEVSLQRRALPREPALHPPRAVGPGDPADLLVLAATARRADRHRPAAGPRCRSLARRGAAAARALPRNLLARALPQRFAQRGARRTASTQPLDRAVRQGARRGRARRCADWQRAALRHARLQQGRGDAGRRRHRGAVVEDHGGAARCPGLYFIGEVVDVTGHLGGFNFQWAWASGHAAGRSRIGSRPRFTETAGCRERDLRR